MNTAEYWERRERDRLKTEQMADAEVNKQIEIIINNHMNRIIETVESFYQKYADENGISNAIAKKRIDQLDMERYEALAEYYVKNRHDKDIAFTDEANKQMRIYNVTMQINREKLILAQMAEHLKNMSAEVETEMKQYLDDSVTREFERQAGLLGSINVSRTQFEAIINSTHLKDGKLWSERLWKNVSDVQKEVDKAITDSLLRGHHPDKSVKRLRELTGRSEFEARRLLITEVTRAQSEAELLSLKDKKVAEFIFLAQIDERTTVKCRSEHKSVHKLSDAKIGINVPPLHQFCRSSIAPHISPEQVVAEGGGTFNIFNDDDPNYNDDDWDEETGSDDGALDELESLLDKIETKTGIKTATKETQPEKVKVKREKVKKQVEEVHEELEDEIDQIYPKGHPFYDKQGIIRQVKEAHPEVSYDELEMSLADDKRHFTHLMDKRDLNYHKNLFNYKMVDKELIHDNIKQYMELMDEFPTVKGMMNDIDHTFQMNNRKSGFMGRVIRNSTHQHGTYKIELELAKNVFSSRERNLRTQKTQSDMNFNMKVDEDNYHLYTLTHEFGHLYHFALAHKLAKATGATFNGELVRDVEDVLMKNYRQVMKAHGIDERPQLSSYARSREIEAIAELFVHFILSSNPVPAAQVMFSVMQDFDEMLEKRIQEQEGE